MRKKGLRTPAKEGLLGDVKFPVPQAGMARLYHLTQALNRRLQSRMPEHTANEAGSLVLPDREDDDRIAAVAQFPVVETEVTSEERHRAEPVQQRDDGVVFGARATDLVANLPDRNAPTTQELALAVRNVLVEDVHAGMSSGA